MLRHLWQADTYIYTVECVNGQISSYKVYLVSIVTQIFQHPYTTLLPSMFHVLVL